MALLKLKNLPYLPKMPDYMSEGVANGLQRELNNLDAVLAEVNGTVMALKTDPRFTQMGREEEITRVLTEANEGVRKVEKAAEGYTRNLEQIEQKMVKGRALKPEEQLVAFLRDQEIRNHLLAMNDKLLVQTAYEEAVRNGKDEVLRAIEDDPVPGHLLTEEHMSKLRSERIRLNNPEVMDQVREIETARGMLNQAIVVTRRELRKHGQIVNDPDLALVTL